MSKKPCYQNNDKVSVEKTELLRGKVFKKVFELISNKVGNLIKEVNNLSEGDSQKDCDKSFCDMFKINLKRNSLPILKKDIIMKKLCDFSDSFYLGRFCRDFIIMMFYKSFITDLFINGIAMYPTNINPYVENLIIGLPLALFCGAMTGMLYHSYRELPNKISFSAKGVLISMLVSSIFCILFTFIGTKSLAIILLIMILEYLLVLTVFTAVTTIYNKLVYLFR